VLSLRWWTGNRGWAGVAQWPNPAIVVWLVALVLRVTGAARGVIADTTLAAIGQGALLVWALDELVRGVSPIRRMMGAVLLVVLLVHLVG
jgi:hypothetical protein